MLWHPNMYNKTSQAHSVILLPAHLHLLHIIFSLGCSLYFSESQDAIVSGLDKDLAQWVLHPILFNLMSILLHI